MFYLIELNTLSVSHIVLFCGLLCRLLTNCTIKKGFSLYHPLRDTTMDIMQSRGYIASYKTTGHMHIITEGQPVEANPSYLLSYAVSSGELNTPSLLLYFCLNLKNFLISTATNIFMPDVENPRSLSS